MAVLTENGFSAGGGARRAAVVAAVVFLVVLTKFILSAWGYLNDELLPYGDAAADTLLVERARHGLLLTGHYTFLGVNHPGPFFLSLRYLSEVLVGRFFDGTMAPHLIAGMATAAAFLGLAAAAVDELAGRGRDGLIAAALTLAAALLQHGGYSGIVTLFMPEVIVVPFLALALTALTTMRGSAAGLVACTVCAAALVHAYIPSAPIAAAVWATAAIVGRRARRRAGEAGFPRPAMMLAAAIIAAFAAPILLDIALNPPGNIMRILDLALQGVTEPGQQERKLWLYLANNLLHLRPFLWLVLIAGLAASLRSRRGLSLWRDLAVVSGLVLGLTMIEFIRAPANFKYYSGFFLVALPLAGVLAAAVVAAPMLTRRPAATAVAVAASVLIFVLVPVKTNWDTRQANPRIKAVAAAVAAATPPGETAVFIAGPEVKPAMYAAAMVELGRRGVFACYENAAQAYYYTRERICGPGVGDRAARFVIDYPPPCAKPGAEEETAPPPPPAASPWRALLKGIVSRPNLLPPSPKNPVCAPDQTVREGRVLTRFLISSDRWGAVRQLD